MRRLRYVRDYINEPPIARSLVYSNCFITYLHENDQYNHNMYYRYGYESPIMCVPTTQDIYIDDI